MQLLEIILRALRRRNDDDFVDQMNYYYTSGLLLMFAIIVSAKQYMGDPITCWLPAHFTSSMREYTENYCWVQNTWFLKLKNDVPGSHELRREREIIYYQWVPFILLFEALLFCCPSIIWRYCNNLTGLDFHHITDMACDARFTTDKRHRGEILSTICAELNEVLSTNFHRNHSKLWRVQSTCITWLYLATKTLFCLNIIAQFLLMNLLLGSSRPYFGWDVLNDLLNGTEWHETGIFPRVTLCDVEAKVMANLHRYTVQCVLVINMINEKIFVFLWFWFALLFLISSLSLLYWLFTIYFPKRRAKLVSILRIKDMCNREENIRRFSLDFLGLDGMFLLWLVTNHAGQMIVNEILSNLWDTYRQIMELKLKHLPQIVIESSSDSDVASFKESLLAPKQQQLRKGTGEQSDFLVDTAALRNNIV